MISWHTEGPFSSSPASGTKARGRGYERKVGKCLRKEANSHSWLFRDHEWLCRESGLDLTPAWLQPDFLIETPSDLYLFEAKLTYQHSAFEQLDRYASWIEEWVFQAPTLPLKPLTQIQVCRNLTPEAPEPFTRLLDIQGTKEKPEQILWHLFL